MLNGGTSLRRRSTPLKTQRHATDGVASFGACLRYPVVLMADKPDTPDRLSSVHAPERLDSWKEIAAYLGRGIRTVQRWEREEGLPVHRLAHDQRGTIYARREELKAWWESRRVTLATPATSDVAAAPAGPRLGRVTRTS